MPDKVLKLAVSVAGHDKGRLYAVLKNEGRSVLLADGKSRKLSAPKRKNIKHIIFLPTLSKTDNCSGLYCEQMTDAALRRLLAEERRMRLKSEELKQDQGGTNIG